MDDTKVALLIVDDSRSMRAYLARTLGTDYEVHDAPNGMAALELMLQEEGFAVVLVDINMPRMDGYEFVRQVRTSNEPWADVPIIMVSSEHESKDRNLAFAVGANAYLVKPVGSQVLLDVVNVVVGKVV